MNMFRSIWEYRGFIFATVRREVRANYKDSILGLAWAVINPLAMVFVYTIVFSQVMRAKLSLQDTEFAYSIYICSGILAWNLFSKIISKAQRMFIDNANIIKKIKFPRISLLAVVVICALIDFLIIFGIFTVFLLMTGNFPGLVYFAAIPLVSILVLLAAGVGVFAGVLNVFFKDTEKIIEIALQFWFWMTPIIYPLDVIPSHYRFFIQINPITPIIQGMHFIFVSNKLPDLNSLYLVMSTTLIICICGISFYKKTVGQLVDEL